MIFSRLGSAIWHVADVLCFILALVAFCAGAYQFGLGWFYLALALSLAFLGWLCEVIAGQKGGDD
ncbi:DUF1056 family protein [Lacticaseibacillus parakribbianus]|uniref:DUF1056 family protein n=1 Tax=Lacticaseibacillus parakribbianus TaxID=2970927 RepID=UPI0021CB48E8|nr:DUF1056 family protein [Lacticaseibacillus parakribbianus]